MADDDTPADARKPTDSGERLDPVRLIAENGSAEAAVRALAFKLNDVERDNAGYRATIADLKGKLPPDGAVVLTADEAEARDAFAAALADAGIETPDKLPAHLQQAGEHAQAVADLARARELKAIEAITGARADAMLDVFRDGEAFEIEGEAPKDGQPDTRKVYVRPRGEGGQPGERAEFGEYVDAHKAALKPALFAEAEAPVTPTAPTFPQQRRGGAAPPQAPDRETLAERKRQDASYNLV